MLTVEANCLSAGAANLVRRRRQYEHAHRQRPGQPQGKDDDMTVLAIAAGALIATWILVLLGSQLLGPR
jgi:hypothetical protein